MSEVDPSLIDVPVEEEKKRKKKKKIGDINDGTSNTINVSEKAVEDKTESKKESKDKKKDKKEGGDSLID